MASNHILALNSWIAGEKDKTSLRGKTSDKLLHLVFYLAALPHDHSMNSLTTEAKMSLATVGETRSADGA